MGTMSIVGVLRPGSNSSQARGIAPLAHSGMLVGDKTKLMDRIRKDRRSINYQPAHNVGVP